MQEFIVFTLGRTS